MTVAKRDKNGPTALTVLLLTGALGIAGASVAGGQPAPAAPVGVRPVERPGTATTEPTQSGQPDPASGTPTAAPGETDWVEIQVRLDRLALSPGEIDGRRGRNTMAALEAFQRKQGIAVTGKPGSATLEALRAASPEPVVTTYTVTGNDVAGPFTPNIPDDLVEQGKLERLGYRDVKELLAERFHTSTALLDRLNPGATFSAGATLQVPAVAPLEMPAYTGERKPTEKPPHPAAEVVVSDTTKTLTALGGDGTILFHAPVTVGSVNDPLPLGEWKVLSVLYSPKFHYNPDLFWDADPSHAKTVIPSGPNNPVGLIWIDLSKEHYGLHGTPEPGRVGHTQSHGCIRLTNWDAVRLASMVDTSTRIVFKQ